MSETQEAPDLFLSYRRSQAAAVTPWVQALREAGIEVWQDTREIEALDDFSAGIAEALSRSKALLVWYSTDYAESIPCQWELTAAFIAAQRAGQPMRRIFVVNPEADAKHIVLPAELANSNYLKPEAGREQDFVAAIRKQLADIREPFGAVRPEAPPEWWPYKPPAAPHFTGRQLDLWKLQSLLLKGSDTTVTAAAPAGRVCIRGLGGMGKTLLAQQYALRFGWAWPGGVYWFDGRGGNRVAGDGYSLRSELEPQFASLGRDFGIHTEGMDADFLRGLVRQSLDKRDAYLWIIDDVPPGVPLNELAAWSAPTARGKTLVSTRSNQYRLVDGELELAGLSAAAGLELLTNRRAPADDAEASDARKIIGQLGGHPLAIEVAAAAIDSAFSDAPYAEFLAALHDTAEDALEPDPDNLDQLPTGHDQSVARTLLGSISLLGDMARQVLLLASRLGEAPIPFDLIVRVLGDAAPSPRALETAVKSLESHALARRDTRARTLQVHPIVNYVVRRWRVQAAAAKALLPRIADTLTDMLGDVEDVRRRTEIDLPLTHSRALAGTAADFLHAPLWLQLSRYDLAIADYAAAERLALAVRNHAPARAKPAGRATVQALNILTDIRYAQGRFTEAADIARQAVDMGNTHLGNEDRDSLTAMNNLAGTLKAQGDLAGVLELNKSVLAIRRRVLGDEYPDTLTSMNNLANTLKAQGDLAGALDLQKSALAIRRRVLGDEHPDTLTSMNNLALTLYDQSDLAGALDLQKSALATRRRVLGDDHPDTLTSMNNLALTLYAQGNLAGALDLEKSALATRRRVLGDEHPGTLTAMNNLALTLKAQDDQAGALDLQKSALATSRRVLGDMHPDTLISAWNLFTTAPKLKDTATAKEVFEAFLLPLLQAVPADLPASSQTIRQRLQDNRTAIESFTGLTFPRSPP